VTVMATGGDRRSIVVVGPSAPPATGMTVMTDMVLASDIGFRVVHVDTADHRSLATMGSLEFENVRHAVVDERLRVETSRSPTFLSPRTGSGSYGTLCSSYWRVWHASA